MQSAGINILLIISGYLLGSIPSSYLVGRAKGIDIRKTIVDGARGASLSWRKIGKVYGVLVGTIDILKGLLAVLIAERVSGEPIIIVLVGLAAIIGHNWSLFMQFTGGRGAATTAGALFYLFPRELSLAFVIVLIPLIVLKRKPYFSFPNTKKEFKTSDFFSGVFFLILFFINISLRGFSIISFASIIYSLPMVLKALTIPEEFKIRAREATLKT